MVDTGAYLDRLLVKEVSIYDIYKPYRIGNREFSAYAYYFTLSEKYILTQKANMWSTRGYDHQLIMECNECTPALLDELMDLVKEHMEPVMVRRGNKYPEKDHMYSYLTLVVLCRKEPDDETKQMIRKFDFRKSYLGTIRGRVETHLAVVDCENEQVYNNRFMKPHRADYVEVFRDVNEGKIGYEEYLSRHPEIMVPVQDR